MIATWRSKLKCGNKVGALTMNLSKAFGTINRYLFLPKLKAYGFNENSVSIIKSYLTNRYQQTEFSSTFSDWNKIITGAPQGSIFFNILNDLPLFANKPEIYNHVDDNTLFSANENIRQIISDLSNENGQENGSMITIFIKS